MEKSNVKEPEISVLTFIHIREPGIQATAVTQPHGYLNETPDNGYFTLDVSTGYYGYIYASNGIIHRLPEVRFTSFHFAGKGVLTGA